MLRLLKFLTAASTGSQCHYINSKVSVVFYWSKICTVVLVISRCSCPNPWPCLTNLQWSTLLSFLWSSHGIWWLLCRFQVCFCGHIHHPNWPLLPGTYDCQPDWTEDHQSPPDRHPLLRSALQHISSEMWSALPSNRYTPFGWWFVPAPFGALMQQILLREWRPNQWSTQYYRLENHVG